MERTNFATVAATSGVAGAVREVLPLPRADAQRVEHQALGRMVVKAALPA